MRIWWGRSKVLLWTLKDRPALDTPAALATCQGNQPAALLPSCELSLGYFHHNNHQIAGKYLKFLTGMLLAQGYIGEIDWKFLTVGDYKFHHSPWVFNSLLSHPPTGTKNITHGKMKSKVMCTLKPKIQSKKACRNSEVKSSFTLWPRPQRHREAVWNQVRWLWPVIPACGRLRQGGHGVRDQPRLHSKTIWNRNTGSGCLALSNTDL